MSYLKVQLQKDEKTKYICSTPLLILGMILKDYHDWNIISYEGVTKSDDKKSTIGLTLTSESVENAVRCINHAIYESDEDEDLIMVNIEEYNLLKDNFNQIDK
jgi:hypothetical protein